MTTRTVRNGATITVPVETGETLKVIAVTGTYTATIVRGTGIGTALATAASGGSYGPYAYQIVVSIASSASSEIDFDVAVTPDVATDTVANYSFDTSGNVTGLAGPGGVKEILLSKAKTGMWANGPISAWQTAYGGYCWRLVTEIPGNARAIRIAVPKSQQGTWTVDGIAVCSTDTASSPARYDPGSGSAWVAGTFDGVTTAKTIAAYTAPDQFQTNSVGDMVWSDWIYCPTIPRVDTVGANPIYVISIYSTSANTMCLNGGSGSETGFNAEPMHRWVQFKAAAGSATVTFASGTSNPACAPVFAIEWAPASSSLSIGTCGDSIMQGAKTTPLSRGYVIKAAATMTSASGYSVSSVNMGVGGDRVISSLNRMLMLGRSDGGLPNMMAFAAYSRNSTATMTAAQMLGVAEVFIKTALKYKVLPVLVSSIAETATPANNTTAATVNAALPAMAAAYGIPYVDLGSLITVANAATYLDVDGVHPNDTGNDLMGVTLGNALIPWINASLHLRQ